MEKDVGIESFHSENDPRYLHYVLCLNRIIDQKRIIQNVKIIVFIFENLCLGFAMNDSFSR
ncbi:hypothetical protein LEP1GSC188_0240 [Leptospira weilii serovar Topaz str. LT2116]|uniref:Uncharacterized protein n=1 Tax=Leptospira weilii serovar Topaz str. LT2116 TaxID=1088540 RepID=M3GZY0_9LEPT|nr:hypothetical protein LEP1GSC188_0240 [Leptospira weilii serovar Topaz str. LT2116]